MPSIHISVRECGVVLIHQTAELIENAHCAYILYIAIVFVNLIYQIPFSLSLFPT